MTLCQGQGIKQLKAVPYHYASHSTCTTTDLSTPVTAKTVPFPPLNSLESSSFSHIIHFLSYYLQYKS